jgi:hypothetical protein
MPRTGREHAFSNGTYCVQRRLGPEQSMDVANVLRRKNCVRIANFDTYSKHALIYSAA